MKMGHRLVLEAKTGVKYAILAKNGPKMTIFDPFDGWCVMLFSTRRIVRGGAIWPPPKKTHKNMCDKCKNFRGFKSRQFIDKNAISSDLRHF